MHSHCSKLIPDAFFYFFTLVEVTHCAAKVYLTLNDRLLWDKKKVVFIEHGDYVIDGERGVASRQTARQNWSRRTGAHMTRVRSHAGSSVRDFLIWLDRESFTRIGFA